jgi:glucosamine-6-phosphate deaminase
MEIVICESTEEAARRAAQAVVDALAVRPESVLALPTGNTPRPVYAELVRLHAAGEVSFAGATVFNLDEYVGLPAGHPASFRRFLSEALLQHVDLPAQCAHAPSITGADLDAAAAAYERAIADAGGIDLALLGIGRNGHIAFNEPGAPFDSRTRVVTLSEATRVANQPAFGAAPVPKQAITVGIATLLEARQCVLLATGAAKAEAVAQAFEGVVSAQVPASALRGHPNLLAVLDRAAASRLTRSPA